MQGSPVIDLVFHPGEIQVKYYWQLSQGRGDCDVVTRVLRILDRDVWFEELTKAVFVQFMVLLFT